jgi:hypothetical protein
LAAYCERDETALCTDPAVVAALRELDGSTDPAS